MGIAMARETLVQMFIGEGAYAMTEAKNKVNEWLRENDAPDMTVRGIDTAVDNEGGPYARFILTVWYEKGTNFVP